MPIRDRVESVRFVRATLELVCMVGWRAIHVVRACTVCSERPARLRGPRYVHASSVTAGLSARAGETRPDVFAIDIKAYTVFCFSVPLSYVRGQGAVRRNVTRSMHLLLCTCVFSMLRMVCSCKAGAHNTILCGCASNRRVPAARRAQSRRRADPCSRRRPATSVTRARACCCWSQQQVSQACQALPCFYRAS